MDIEKKHLPDGKIIAGNKKNIFKPYEKYCKTK